MKTPSGLFVTVVAILFLLLDGVLLIWVGLAFDSATLLVLGLGFLLAAAGVVVYYRKYLRDLDDLQVEQLTLKSEMESMLAVARQSATRKPEVSGAQDG